jgi:lipopolysaccharide exporter
LTTERRFLDSSLAAYASQLGRLAIALGSRMLLARLIAPDGHGVYELALRVVTVAAALRDLGLPYHLMRDSRRPYGTVLAFVLASGLVVTLLVVLGAPLLSGLDPDLPPILRVYAVWILLDGLVIVPKTFFERELRIGRLVMPEILRAAAMALVAVVLAARGWGVWSLIWADLAATAAFAVMVWWRAAGRMSLRAEPRLILELLRSSRYLFLVWLLFQIVTYVDVFIVGAYRDATAVGQYSRAYWIAFLTAQIMAPRALLPALVEYLSDSRRFAAAFRVGTVFLMSFQVVAGYFLFFNAERVVRIILGPSPEWLPAVALLRILCFVPFLDAFTDLGGEVLKVRGDDRVWLASVALNLLSLAGFGILFTSWWGPTGMAVANFLLIGHLLMVWRVSRIFAAVWTTLVRDLALVYLVPLLPFLAVAALLPVDSWERLAGSVAAALIAFGALALRFQGPFREFWKGDPNRVVSEAHDPARADSLSKP